MKKYILLLALILAGCGRSDYSHTSNNVENILNNAAPPVIVVSKSARISNWETNSSYEILFVDGKGEFWTLYGQNYDMKKGDTLKK